MVFGSHVRLMGFFPMLMVMAVLMVVPMAVSMGVQKWSAIGGPILSRELHAIVHPQSVLVIAECENDRHVGKIEWRTSVARLMSNLTNLAWPGSIPSSFN